jgi:hypothetical protein
VHLHTGDCHAELIEYCNEINLCSRSASVLLLIKHFARTT